MQSPIVELKLFVEMLSDQSCEISDAYDDGIAEYALTDGIDASLQLSLFTCREDNLYTD